MNTENTASSNLITPEPAHQERHHRRAVIAVAVLLALLVLGGLLFQFLSTRKEQREVREAALLEEYQQEQLAAAQKFFEEYASSDKPATAEEIKAQAEFLAKYSSDPMTEDDMKRMQDGLATLQKLQDEKYKAWKSGRAAQ